MKRQWLVLILILAGLVTFAAEDFMDEAIITPTLYFFWLGRLILNSVPQGIIWGIFLILAVILTWRSVFQRPKLLLRSPALTRQEPGRIEEWARLVHRAEQEVYYKWQLAQRLQKLTLSALAHNERVSVREIRNRLVNDHLALPPDIQAYFRASIISFGHFTTGKSWLFGRQPKETPLDLEPEKIAQFLEEKFDL